MAYFPRALIAGCGALRKRNPCARPEIIAMTCNCTQNRRGRGVAGAAVAARERVNEHQIRAAAYGFDGLQRRAAVPARGAESSRSTVANGNVQKHLRASRGTNIAPWHTRCDL
jgi:hypothetical protein